MTISCSRTVHSTQIKDQSISIFYLYFLLINIIHIEALLFLVLMISSSCWQSQDYRQQTSLPASVADPQPCPWWVDGGRRMEIMWLTNFLIWPWPLSQLEQRYSWLQYKCHRLIFSLKIMSVFKILNINMCTLNSWKIVFLVWQYLYISSQIIRTSWNVNLIIPQIFQVIFHYNLSVTF